METPPFLRALLPGTLLPGTLLFAALSLPLTGQRQAWFEAHRPQVWCSVRDLPGLQTAVASSSLGHLLADEEVADAVELARTRFDAASARWTEVIAAWQALAPGDVLFRDRVELAVRELDWHDLHSVALIEATPADDHEGQGNAAAGQRSSYPVFVLRGTEAGRDRVTQRFATLATTLRDSPPNGTELAAEQVVDGGPGLVLATGAPVNEATQVESWPLWLVERDGAIVGGKGDAATLGHLAPFASGPPEVRFGFDLRRLSPPLARDHPEDLEAAVFAASDADAIGRLEWRLGIENGDVRDDFTVQLAAKPSGVLGALLEGGAPLPDQPLPEGAMLQLRFAFDVDSLLRIVDEHFAAAEDRTLATQGILDDLKRAWTGGLALGIARPAPGALVPRLYASFGIGNADALARLLARVRSIRGFEARDREVDGTMTTMLTIPDLPAAVRPTFALVDGTLHVAESSRSLRDLLEAKADGAPRTLDVGDAVAPRGPGRLVPTLELRYDTGAIAAALQEVWLPLVGNDVVLQAGAAILPLGDMPEPETLAAHLGRGRAALWRDGDRLTLSMAGALGGPELCAFAIAFGPLLSARIGAQGYQLESARLGLIHAQMRSIHAAIAAFSGREGHRPRTLGELLATGDLVDATALVVPGLELTEPVTHDGKELARSSYRYYPDGLAVSPMGQQVQAQLIGLDKLRWRRPMLTTDGTYVEGWGTFAESTLDELEQQAKR